MRLDIFDPQKHKLLEKLQAELGEIVIKAVSVCGLALGPNTDDVPVAKSCTLLESLWKAGAAFLADDLVASHEFARISGDRPDIVREANEGLAAGRAYALAICTQWQQFRDTDSEELPPRLKSRIVVDGYNLYALDRVRDLGWIYISLGRNSVAG